MFQRGLAELNFEKIEPVFMSLWAATNGAVDIV